MTMPHLMNCNHLCDGWCLDCVKREHDENERIIEGLMANLECQKAEVESLQAFIRKEHDSYERHHPYAHELRSQFQFLENEE